MDPNPQSDANLIDEYFNGNRTALSQLWLRYDPMVYGIALSMVKRYDLAEDLRQEIFLKMYRGLPSLKEWDKFACWLKTITYNTCKTWLSTQQQEHIPLEELKESEHPSVSITDEVEYKQHRTLLGQMIDELPFDYRLVINLHYFEGQTVTQIAKFLSLPESTVKWRIHKAREMLQEKAKVNGYV